MKFLNLSAMAAPIKGIPFPPAPIILAILSYQSIMARVYFVFPPAPIILAILSYQ